MNPGLTNLIVGGRGFTNSEDERPADRTTEGEHVSKGSFKFNAAGLAALQRDLEKKFSGGISIPLEVDEDAAIRDVKKQLADLGVEPNDVEVRRLVRESRAGGR